MFKSDWNTWNLRLWKFESIVAEKSFGTYFKARSFLRYSFLFHISKMHKSKLVLNKVWTLNSSTKFAISTLAMKGLKYHHQLKKYRLFHLKILFFKKRYTEKDGFKIKPIWAYAVSIASIEVVALYLEVL